MKDSINTSILFNEAAKSGAVLGLISTAYMFLTQIMSTAAQGSAMATFAVSTLTLVLWAVKFWLCIYLVKFFMEKLVKDYDGVTNSSTFKLGVLIALFSALLYAAFSMANVLLISPETYTSSIDEVLAQYSTILDSNSMAAMENISQHFGTITFFSNFIYCFLFGVVVSAIYSRRIPKVDEFAEFKQKNDSIDQQ